MSVTTPITKQEQQVYHDYGIPVHESLSVFENLKAIENMQGTFADADVNLTDLLEDYVAAQLDFNRLVDTINQSWGAQVQTWHKFTGDRLMANTKAHMDAFMPFEQERTKLVADAQRGFPQQLLQTPREQWKPQDNFGFDYIMFQVDLKWEFFNIMEIMANLNEGADINAVATEIQAKLAPKHGPKEHVVKDGQEQPIQPAEPEEPQVQEDVADNSEQSQAPLNEKAFPGQVPDQPDEDSTED